MAYRPGNYRTEYSHYGYPNRSLFERLPLRPLIPVAIAFLLGMAVAYGFFKDSLKSQAAELEQTKLLYKALLVKSNGQFVVSDTGKVQLSQPTATPTPGFVPNAAPTVSAAPSQLVPDSSPYTNTLYRYSLNLPRVWKISEETSERVDATSSDGRTMLSVIKEAILLRDLVDRFKQEALGGSLTEQQQQTGGQSWTVLKYPDGAVPAEMWMIEHDGKTFRLERRYAEPALFQQIVASFHFAS